ncbi:MAG: 1,2-phenylacetyl-CoA epoxidase subunit A [Chloroflexi bacterium]|nr:1,2-phenylacetyl-CoA epoxidase subunit A [Chloroflexota bacterium]
MNPLVRPVITDDDGRSEDEKLVTFEARVAAGEKIEPTDWMPDRYRQQLIRMVQNHGNSEIVGALPEREWIPHAPTFKRKLALTAKVQDEVGHAQLLYRVVETLGKPREVIIEELLNGTAKYSNVFNYPPETWADVGIIAWLIDAAAIIRQMLLREGSYGPYSRALKRICYEESFHLKHGHDICVTLATGTQFQRDMLQDALNRWWNPIVGFFGPPDRASVHTDELMRWRVKLKTNDAIRQQFFDQYVPRIWELGLSIPDPELRKDDESGRWLYTEPDWEEFKRVIKGHGPCNAERIAVRRLAHEEGEWVRRALAAAANDQAVPVQ